jgi:hypothetical protein
MCPFLLLKEWIENEEKARESADDELLLLNYAFFFTFMAVTKILFVIVI